ncbi:MAG TPA: MFS transporter, partial [Gaiellales bacterium]|nr:MFS transporter [Gaiellales bacterium]
MVVAFALVIGLSVAWMLGANPMRLADVRFRGSALVFGALGIQLAIYTPLTAHIPHSLDKPLHLFSYLMLIGFFLLNLRVPAFWLVGFGLLSNTAVIFANGGHMPITAEGWVAAGGTLSDFNSHGFSANSVLMGPGTRLPWLGDVFALPIRIPTASVLSIGDLLIVLGTVAFVYRSCAPTVGPQTANILAPLRSAAFRRVIAGRLVSSVGDNLTQAAVVTWIYWTSRSVALVSAFLIVRMLSSAFGGLASAPLLDRIPAFTTLSVVETLRAGVACAMIPFAAAGQVWPVIGLGAVSSLLSAATSPTAQGMIPDVLPAEQRQAGNAIHQMARSLTAVVGALVGGLAVVEFSIQWALTIDLATFLVAAVLYRRYGRQAGPAAHEQAEEAPRTSRRELARAILLNRVVFGLAASFTLVTGAVGILNSASSKVFDEQLGNAHAYGYILAVISAGYVCSEILTGYMRRQSVARRSVGLSFIVTAGAMYILSGAETA